MSSSASGSDNRSRRLLARQLRKAGLSPSPETPELAHLLALIEETYDEFERDRRLTDHSTQLASDELSNIMATLAANERLFRSLARCSPNGILYTDGEGRCLYANQRTAELAGCTPADLEGFGWLSKIPEDDRPLIQMLPLNPDLAEESELVLEHRLQRPDGEIIWVSTSIAGVDEASVDSPAALGWVAHIEDITERKLYESELSRLARQDSLTQLDNRYALAQHLSQMCRDAGQGRRVAVGVIDLDRFKLVNDTFGHEAGDQLLVEVARKLQAAAGEHDVVARLGGDEFAFATMIGANESPALLGEQISRAIHGPVHCGDRMVHVAGSVGIAVSSSVRTNPDELLRDADTAMYRAKRSATTTFQIFDDSFRAEVTSRFLMESELREAVEQDEVQLAYQPIVDAVSRQLKSIEALARWDNPRVGAVSPIEFVALAEDLGLIAVLGDQLLNKACAQLAAWRREHRDLNSLTLSFNTSALQLCDVEFPKSVVRALARHHLPASALVIEITENAIVSHLDLSMSVLDELREAGVAIAIDDFGTGYSSLSYLERLPVDFLKIDKSFVQAMGDDDARESSNRLTETIVELAHRLGLTPVAEGVETDLQRRLLRQAGCGLIQGHLYAKAMPPDDPELQALLRGGLVTSSADLGQH